MKKIALIIVVFISITSCSSRFVYSNLDWLIHWYVDDYVDLSHTQKPLFNQRMSEWLSWHQNEELGRYLTQLQQLNSDLENNNLSTDRLEYHFNVGQSHWFRLRDRITPDLVTLAKSLSDDQIDSIYAAIERDNQDLEQEHKASVAKYSTAHRATRLENNITRWTGKLAPQQKALIAQHAIHFENNYEQWFADRRRIQNSARQLLISRHKDPDFEDKLVQLLSNPSERANPDYLAANQNNRRSYANLLASLAPTLTEKQKSRVQKEIGEYINDLSSLTED